MSEIIELFKNLYSSFYGKLHIKLNDIINNKNKSLLSYCILKPISLIYEYGSISHKLIYDMNIFKKKSLDIYTISIGNITMGGTGKTPMVEYLSKIALENHSIPIIISRGYGNDEKYQLYSKFKSTNAVFAIGSSREWLAKKKISTFNNSEKKPTIAILDDGFQHWKLKRDIDIVMINAYDPWGNDNIVPLGRLRERPESALRRANIIVIHNATGRINPSQVDNIYNKIYNNVSKSVPVFESKTAICGLYKCENNNFIQKNITDIEQKDILAISGIGCPVAFKHLLEDQLNIKSIVQKIFPDHYRFSEKDVNIIYEKNKVDKKIIVITEKDYYRCVNNKTQHFIEKLNPYIIMTELKIIKPDNSGLLLRDLCKKRV